MKRVEAVFRSERLAEVSYHLEQAGLSGFTIADVRGHGNSPESKGEWRGQSYELHVTHKLLITIFVDDEEVPATVEAITMGASTGKLGDGMIAVSDIQHLYKISPAAGEA